MPRCNRVTPFGQVVAIPERGTLMGNRGILHDPDGQVRRAWQVKRWLLCVLEFRGRRRTVMAPNRYTELFFLDEATGLAAGHRPCFECQRTRYLEFRAAWDAGHSGGNEPATPTPADMIDDQLHRERVDRSRRKQVYRACLDDLPDGVFVVRDSSPLVAELVYGDRLLAWSPAGYSRTSSRPAGEVVSVLTPRSTVAVIHAGFTPGVHPSANQR